MLSNCKEDRVSVVKGQYKPLPPLSVHFIKRAAIFKQISETFFDARGKVKTGQNRFVSYGPGGSGKTQSSTKFCEEFRDRYVECGLTYRSVR